MRDTREDCTVGPTRVRKSGLGGTIFSDAEHYKGATVGFLDPSLNSSRSFVEERLVSSGAGMDFGVVARTKELDDPRVLQLQYGLSAAHDACTPSTPHSSSREPCTPFSPLTPFKHLTPFFESRTASRSDAAAHMHSGLPDRRALTVVKPSPRKGPSLSHGGPGDGSLKSSPAGRLGFDSSFTKLPVIPRDKP